MPPLPKRDPLSRPFKQSFVQLWFPTAVHVFFSCKRVFSISHFLLLASVVQRSVASFFFVCVCVLSTDRDTAKCVSLTICEMARITARGCLCDRDVPLRGSSRASRRMSIIKYENHLHWAAPIPSFKYVNIWISERPLRLHSNIQCQELLDNNIFKGTASYLRQNTTGHCIHHHSTRRITHLENICYFP